MVNLSYSHNSGTSVVFSLRFSHPESLAVGDSFFAMPWMATVGGRIIVGFCLSHIQDSFTA